MYLNLNRFFIMCLVLALKPNLLVLLERQVLNFGHRCVRNVTRFTEILPFSCQTAYLTTSLFQKPKQNSIARHVSRKRIQDEWLTWRIVTAPAGQSDLNTVRSEKCALSRERWDDSNTGKNLSSQIYMCPKQQRNSKQQEKALHLVRNRCFQPT